MKKTGAVANTTTARKAGLCSLTTNVRELPNESPTSAGRSPATVKLSLRWNVKYATPAKATLRLKRRGGPDFLHEALARFRVTSQLGIAT